jgi:uncharacterized membrane protein YbhN (UPF0104 family)
LTNKKGLNKKLIIRLIKLLVALAALFFVAYKLTADIAQYEGFADLIKLKLRNSQHFYLVALFFLISINWLIEAYKWKALLKAYVCLSIFTSLKSVLIGLLIGNFTPFKAADLPARALLLPAHIRKRAIFLAFVNSFSQLLVTIVLGLISLLFIPLEIKLKSYFYVIHILLFIISISFYFLSNKMGEKVRQLKERMSEVLKLNLYTKIQVLSFIRYLVFLSQYFILFRYFEIQISPLNLIFSVAAVLFVANILPLIQIIDIGVKGSAAIYVFGLFSIDSLPVIAVFILIWLLSVVIPMLLGLIFFLRYNFHKKSVYLN